MKIIQYLIRYHPPGIILEYDKEKAGTRIQHSIHLPDLAPHSDARRVTEDILRSHSKWVSRDRFRALMGVVTELITRLRSDPIHKYERGSISSKPTYQNLHRINAHLLSMTAFQLNKAGDRLITGSYDRTCKIWDLNTGRELTKLVGHEHAVSCVGFNNPYANRVVTGSFDATCAIWDTATGNQLAILHGHSAEVTTVSYAGVSCLTEHQLLVSGSRDASARVWDPTTGTALLQPFLHDDEVVCTEASSDGRLVLTGSFDTTCRLWDIRTPKSQPVRIFGTSTSAALVGHPDDADALELDIKVSGGQKGISSATKSQANHITRHMTSSDKEVSDGHRGEITRAVLNWDATQAVSASMDGFVKIWDIGTGRCVSTISGSGSSRSHPTDDLPTDSGTYGEHFTKQNISQINASTSPSVLPTASTGGTSHHPGAFALTTTELPSAAAFSSTSSLDIGHPTAAVTDISLDMSGRLLATASEDGQIKLIDTLTGRVQGHVTAHAGQPIVSVRFNSFGTQIISSGEDGTAQIWQVVCDSRQNLPIESKEMETPQMLQHWQSLTGHQAGLFTACFSYNSDLVVTGSTDNTCRIWKISNTLR